MVKKNNRNDDDVKPFQKESVSHRCWKMNHRHRIALKIDHRRSLNQSKLVFHKSLVYQQAEFWGRESWGYSMNTIHTSMHEPEIDWGNKMWHIVLSARKSDHLPISTGVQSLVQKGANYDHTSDMMESYCVWRGASIEWKCMSAI